MEFLGNYKSRWTMHNCCANNKHTRKDFNASLVAADCWLYCTQQPGCFLGANLWGLCGTCGCGWVVGFIGSARGGIGEDAGVCLCYVQDGACGSSLTLLGSM